MNLLSCRAEAWRRRIGKYVLLRKGKRTYAVLDVK